MSTPNRRRESRVKRSDDCKTELSVPHSTVSTSTLRTIPIPVASVLQLDGSGGFRNTCRWSCTPATVTTAPTTNPLTEVVDGAMTTCSFSDGLTVTVDSVSICEVCDTTPRRQLSSSECPATQVSQRSISTECGRGLDVRVVSPVRALPPPPNRSCSPLVYACGRKAATSVPRTCSSGCLGEHPHVNGPLAAGTGDRSVGHPLERVAAPAAAVQLNHGKQLPPQVIMSPSSVSSEFQQSCQLHLAHGGGGSIDTFLDELEEHDAPHLFPFLLHLQFSASRSRISADSSASPTLEPRRDSQSTGALVASRDINDTPPDLPWLRLFLPLAEDVRDEVGTASSARSTPSVASSNSFPPHVYRRRTVKKYKLAHPRRATRNASANTARRGNLIDPQTSRSTPPRPNPPSAKPLLTPLSTRIRRRSFPNASALPTCDGEDMQRKTDQVGLCEVVEPFGPYPYSWRSFSDNVLSQTPPQ